MDTQVEAASPPLDHWRRFVYCTSCTSGVLLGEVLRPASAPCLCALPRQSPAPPSSESHPFSCASSACQVDHFPEDGVSSSVSPTGPRHLSQNRFVPLVHEALRNYPGALVGFALCARARPSQPLRLAAEVQLRFGQEISSLIEADDHVTLVTSYVHLYRTRSILTCRLYALASR